MGRLLRVAGFILGLSLLFVGAILLLTFGISLVMATVWGHSLSDPETIYAALTCGLIACLFVAVFHLRKESVQIPLHHNEDFVEKANGVMKELGYEVVQQSADQILSRPRFYSFLLGGGVRIRIDKDAVKITGPRVMAEIVRKRLRLRTCIDQVHQPSRRSQGRLLKRVQISVKVKPHLIAEMQKNVIDPLCKEGDVVCMVTVLAQSDAGIRELTPDCPIRVWLDKQGLRAEFHREHVELTDPLQLTPAEKLNETLTGQDTIP